MSAAPLDAEAVRRGLAGGLGERVRVIRAGAMAGVAEAQCVLGQMLLDGHGLPRDAAAGAAWFARAAAQHHAMGLNMLGRCHELGWGVPVDKARAAQCFRAAAELGLDWGMVNWATALAVGAGVAPDRAAALGWFRRAAAMGNAKAANHVGSFLEDGWATPRDADAAERQYRVAATGGDFRGALNLARMLAARGRRVEALQWFRAAARDGNPPFRARALAWLRAAPSGFLAGPAADAFAEAAR